MDGNSAPRPRGPFAKLIGFLLIAIGAFASLATNLADDPKSETPSDNGVTVCETATECATTEGEPHCLTSYGFCVQCLQDEHCGEQERCYEYRCEAKCESDAACGGDLVCLDGLCRNCSRDTDCADPGQYCYIGPDFSACQPLCTSSEECSGPGFVDGDVCRAGKCQPVPCRAAQDCLLDREQCDLGIGQCRSLL
ncbi:MAG: hypothetical protein AUK47_04930 [Deltaproteobacteria bacterium CG2_30_63_29]|nr:MAG: hypothetical protein AUK47_04930 [Deltaproteobacteria bacterium CG2_30_63_29]PIV99534.1 MAG: hypothetical protein COW42_10780 [Deltaproteobacteria bacterium CG17_big_fil_post_rev_8_21_14_2_50_63_7]PJB46151.1 MAG: hypothetical protein CO108_06185 [Deltaproteobacteria bacterium CG_4_9_14_3_um_filter_63_12]